MPESLILYRCKDWLQGKSAAGPDAIISSFSSCFFSQILYLFQSSVYVEWEATDYGKTFTLIEQPEPVQCLYDDMTQII